MTDQQSDREEERKKYFINEMVNHTSYLHWDMEIDLLLYADKKKMKGEGDAMPLINGNSFLQLNYSRVKRNIVRNSKRVEEKKVR